MTTCTQPMDERTVLIVEDSRFQRNTLARELTNWNYSVLEAKDGVEALDMYKANFPKLIITDLHMPRMDGFELVSAIRENQVRYTYIIVISGMEDKDSIVTALGQGADDYVVKPFHPGELEVRLSAAERILSLESQELLIFSLARLADYRSRETGYHLERVKHYTRLLAEELSRKECPELGSARIAVIESMSVLHDIGKVAIPDYILNKPGKLSKLEYSIMKKHPSIGGEMLMEIYQKTGSEQLRVARDVVMYHHERYDGAGYPHGLSEDDIPLAARIVALADVFDALSSPRCYKPAFDRMQCEAIIKEEKGRHFDPMVVDAYFRVCDEFWSIQRDLADE